MHFSPNREDIHCECIKCLRAIMNSKDGLKQIFDHEDALKIVAETFDPRFPLTMVVCFTINFKSKFWLT